MPDYGAIKTATISHSADGDATIIAAVTGKQIIILGYALGFTGTVGVCTFKSGANEIGRIIPSANSTGPFSAWGRRDVPVLVCNPGEAFVINNAAALDTHGHCAYMLVNP